MIESLKEYESILDSDDLAIRRKAATETATAEVWLDILVRRPDLAEDVAFNKHLPATILDILIDSSSAHVRSTIAMKRGLEHKQFEKLAKDNDDSVRIMIANNRKTPQPVLEELEYDSCESVSLAANLQLQVRSNAS